MKYKILIIDDEEMLTELLSEHLQKCGYLPYTANSAEEALDQLKIAFDLIILDINMPEMDGLQLCKLIRSHITCPILFLTARITQQDQIIGFMMGGDDYITKPFNLPELTARISAHLRREERSKGSTKLLSSGGLIINSSRRTVYYGDKEILFSKREFDIVEFLASNAGQVFDRERLYHSVWGIDAEGDSGVIKEHIRKIRQNLYNAVGKEYIETVWGVGYRWKK